MTQNPPEGMPEGISEGMSVADRLADVRGRIEAAGGDAEVKVLAVTKGFGAEAIEAAVAAGLGAVGENYAQELEAKRSASLPPVEWHFIGRLQRNKVRRVAHLVDVWQSIDRIELGREIAKRAPNARVFVQVNFAGELQKGGVSPSATAELVEALRSLGLAVEGLMTVGVMGDAAASARAFVQCSELADGLGLVERSMGMTADLEAAVGAGSTMVRVGTALFGPRQPGVQRA